ncbi:peptidoglycan-binding protein [Plantibacter sp. VKM Ac-2876]|uniref:peptidoglycan-binding protein n=1 Tax=Plantibacter sp. VKM Ac-2876 TaxID=2783826 RepID=UPI00188B2CF1|nr:peptidoglycan-binding protein [Plantibacter sp. VKM Ac-2876]MBF4563658.1 peptidoglycan-binding protein [Plantibacter sp. VKM Ac-2876]
MSTTPVSATATRQADDDELVPPDRPRRRRATIVVLAIASVVAVAGAAVFLVSANSGSSASTTEGDQPAAATVPIAQGELAGTSEASGTLDYTDKRKLGSALGGTITQVPVPGAVIGLGQSLFAVDNVPVPLLHGPLPAWRGFASGMSDGPDVLALEMSLAALGYFDRVPDTEFAWSTRAAIERWQHALGVPETGELPLGSVVFQPGDVRVGAVDAPVGTPASPDIITVTATTKRIDVSLKPNDQQLAVIGAAVGVRLPDGSTTTGTVTEVGVPTERDDSNGKPEVVIPVGIALDDPAVTGELQRASVTVSFPSERRENVLSVPVEALIALDEQTFGVEVVEADGTHRKVPVTTGLFAGGLVEIAGDGLKAGLKVVVPR